jgi:voltage-gated potassium channel
MQTHFHIGWKHFWRQIFRVIRNPIFFVLTIVGNGILVLSAHIFFIVEHPVNPTVRHFLDALWWAIITMTTIGYGDIIPMTLAGRAVAVFLIFTGGVLFLSFIALLASAFIELEFSELEHEVSDLKKKISDLTEKSK